MDEGSENIGGDNGATEADSGTVGRAIGAIGAAGGSGGQLTVLGWPQVQAILDRAIADWKTKHHRDPDLTGIHGPTLKWDTLDSLKAASVSIDGDQFPLIEPGKAGKDTNLILALKAGVSGYPRMPLGGPFLLDTDTDQIASWIDAGMPD